jgi:hypothetical protein
LGRCHNYSEKIKKIVKRWRVWARDKMAPCVGCKAFRLASSQTSGSTYSAAWINVPLAFEEGSNPSDALHLERGPDSVYLLGHHLLLHTNETRWRICYLTKSYQGIKNYIMDKEWRWSSFP